MMPVCPCQMPPKAFGRWARQERAARGLKQRELAALVQMDPAKLCRIEHGHATRSPAAVRALIHFFTCQPPRAFSVHLQESVQHHPLVSAVHPGADVSPVVCG